MSQTLARQIIDGLPGVLATSYDEKLKLFYVTVENSHAETILAAYRPSAFPVYIEEIGVDWSVIAVELPLQDTF